MCQSWQPCAILPGVLRPGEAVLPRVRTAGQPVAADAAGHAGRGIPLHIPRGAPGGHRQTGQTDTDLSSVL